MATLPSVVAIAQTVTPDKQLASVTLHVDLVDLEAFLASVDVSAIKDSASYRDSLDSAAALGKIHEAESAAQSAADVTPEQEAKAKRDELAKQLTPRSKSPTKGDK